MTAALPSSLRLLILGLIALVLPVSGCGTQSAASGKSPLLRIWYSTDDPVERHWIQQLVGLFEKAHPTIPVRLTVYSFEDINTKLQLALSAGDPPDLAYVTPRGPGIPVYVQNHQLRDLTAAAQAQHWAASLRPGLLAQYNAPFAFYGARRGHVVSVPMALAAVGILYNRQILSHLHLAVPRTITQFTADLARAKAAGYTPLGMGNEDGWLGDDWYLSLVNSLIPPSSLQREQQLDPHFSFRRAPFVAAARTLKQWSQAGYYTNDFGGLDAQEGVDLFFRGHTLFQLVSSSQNAQINQDQRQTRLPVGVFAFPATYGGTVMPQSGYEGWVVPAAGHNPSAAVTFISYVLSPSAATFLLHQALLPAARMSTATGTSLTWQQEYLQALNTSRPGVYLDAAPVANLNATMEANVQLLLQGYEAPPFLSKSLQEDYASHGSRGGSTARIDGEF